MLFLYHGQLSWQKQNSVARVVEIKQQFDWLHNTIGEFVIFVMYCRNLGFVEKPNYDYLRGLLENRTKI